MIVKWTLEVEVECGVNGVTLVPDGIEMTTIDSVRIVVNHCTHSTLPFPIPLCNLGSR